MDKVVRKHRQLFIAFISVFVVFAVLVVLVLTSSWQTDVKMSVFLILLILLMVVSVWFRPRLYFHAMQVSFVKLKASSHHPISTKHDLTSKNWLTYLTRKKFNVFKDLENFIVMQRYTQDPKEYITKNPMLEVIIVIRDEAIAFDDKRITKTVNELEDDYQNKKIKILNYSIIQIKYGNTMTDQVKEQVDQVVFDKQNGRHITVINGYFQTSSQTLYFLHSKKFVPSLYYKYVVDLIKSLIS